MNTLYPVIVTRSFNRYLTGQIIPSMPAAYRDEMMRKGYVTRHIPASSEPVKRGPGRPRKNAA